MMAPRPQAAAPAVVAPQPRPSGASLSGRLSDTMIRRIGPDFVPAVNNIKAFSGNPSRIDSPEEAAALTQLEIMSHADASIEDRVAKINDASDKNLVVLKATGKPFYSADRTGACDIFGTDGKPGMGPVAQNTELLWPARSVEIAAGHLTAAGVDAAAVTALAALTEKTGEEAAAADAQLTTVCKARTKQVAPAAAASL